MARHVIEALGMTRVVVEDEKVVEVGEPSVEYCPLFAKHKGIDEITSDVVRENIEFRMRDFGFCTQNRSLRMKDFLSFGVSELMSMAVIRKILDSAVIVCDGAGTCVVSEPEMIQGIGGRMSGMIETAPISSVIDGIGRKNVLDPESAEIDQFKGVLLAFNLGFEKPGVSVALAKDARRIRERFDGDVVILAVHTSGLNAQDARTIIEHSDLVTACASRTVRKIASERGFLRAGNKVPVYATSEKGENILKERFRQTNTRPSRDAEDPPVPLI